MNGDGYSDILVGSPAAGTLSQGFTYLVFGGAELPASFDLKSGLDGTDGVVFKGAMTGGTVVILVTRGQPTGRLLTTNSLLLSQ